MFVLYADKTRLTLRQREPLSSGSGAAHRARFRFSPDWDGLSKTAIFRAGTESRAVLLGEDNEGIIPFEVLQKPNLTLYCGVYGVMDGHVALPVIWTDLGIIHPTACFNLKEGIQ